MSEADRVVQRRVAAERRRTVRAVCGEAPRPCRSSTHHQTSCPCHQHSVCIAVVLSSGNARLGFCCLWTRKHEVDRRPLYGLTRA